jgi:hypothetical protein
MTKMNWGMFIMGFCCFGLPSAILISMALLPVAFLWGFIFGYVVFGKKEVHKE